MYRKLKTLGRRLTQTKKKCNPLNCKSLFSFHIAVSYKKNNLTGISTYELNDKYTDLIL